MCIRDRVYRARDLRLSRVVALKFISVTDDLLRKRFLTEARAQARLHHENICKVFEVGEVEGHPYIAMELVEGSPLSSLHRRLNREQKLTLMRDIAQAVHSAHSLGIIHRDLKPANVMVAQREDGSLRPVVMDFGLARDQSSEEHLTMTGMVMGTPAYMSPEQAQGEVHRIDRRSDVYSLGAMLYELLTGQLPFAGATTVAMILQVIQHEPPPLRKVSSEIPIDLETIAAKAMAKEIQRRYDTARALAEDLDRFLTGEPILARKASLFYIAYKRAQKHKAVVAVSALCLLSVIALLLVFVRARMVAQRERQRTDRQAQLAQQLGQDITQMELFMRAAYMLPIHDIRREQAVVRARMQKLSTLQNSQETELRGPAYYALGRGHQVLQEYAEARVQLEHALSVGYDRPEVHFALGMVLGQLYQKGVMESRQEIDPTLRKQKLAKMETELLSATRAHLAQSVGSQIDSVQLVEGWIHFYQKEWEPARKAALAAATEAPWDYQPLHLQLAVALKYAEQVYYQHQPAEIESANRQVKLLLDRLTELARSLPTVYLTRVAFYREQLMHDLIEHRPMDANLASMTAAIDQLHIVSPGSAMIRLEKAGAYAYLARQKQEFGEDPRPAAMEAEAALQEAEQGGAATENINLLRNNILFALASYAEKHADDPRPYLRRAAELLEQTVATSRAPLPMWNDLCATFCELARHETIYGQDASVTLERGWAACRHAVTVNPELYVGYANQGSWYLEEGRANLLKHKAVDIKPGVEALALAEARKPGDSEVMSTEFSLHLLQAESLQANKLDPLPALQIASNILQKHRNAFPTILASYVMSAELLRTRIELAASSVTQSELQSGLTLIEEGLSHFPSDPDLLLGKAKLLLFRLGSAPKQSTRTDLSTAHSLLNSVRPILGHRKQFVSTQALADRLSGATLKSRNQ